MTTFEYVVSDPLGIHARPAGILVKKAAAFASKVTIENANTGKAVDAKRIMGVMSLGVKQGNTVILTMEGEDEETAKAELEAFMKENL